MIPRPITPTVPFAAFILPPHLRQSIAPRLSCQAYVRNLHRVRSHWRCCARMLTVASHSPLVNLTGALPMSNVSLDQASTIVDVALKKGRETNCAPLTVAVLDAGGHLVAFKREDKSGIVRFDIAFGKAWGALGMGFGSRELGDRAAKNPLFFGVLATVSQGRLVPVPSGVLVLQDGEVIGAVGIS